VWMCAGAWGVQCVELCAFLPEQSCRSMSSVTEVEEGGPSRLRREGWSDLLSSVSLCVVAAWSRDSASGILNLILAQPMVSWSHRRCLVAGMKRVTRRDVDTLEQQFCRSLASRSSLCPKCFVLSRHKNLSFATLTGYVCS
jgi:hypothetical protein